MPSSSHIEQPPFEAKTDIKAKNWGIFSLSGRSLTQFTIYQAYKTGQ